MITELTSEQQAALVAHRQRYFDLATCTDPTDRPKAEAAARALAEIAGVKVGAVVWVNNPEEGKAEYDRALASLQASLRDSLRYNLEASLWASLRDSLRYNLEASLQVSLGASLGDSLGASLGDSLWASLRASFWASLQDTDWLACYAFGRTLGIAYDPAQSGKLDLWIAALESCFAVWIVPGAIILCERPETVKVVRGNLVGITWRT
jgi:hypothetical protein